MQTHKILIGLCLGVFLFPHLEVMASDYEYGWLQNAQLRTFENKRLREAQRKEKIRKAKEFKQKQKEQQRLSAEQEKKRLKAMEEERRVRREKALKEAAEEAEYQAILQERSKKLKAIKQEIQDLERYQKEQWTKFSQQKSNTKAHETRTKYETRKRKRGYVPVSEVKFKNNGGFVENYMKKKTQNQAVRRKSEPNRYRGFYRRLADE